MARKAMSCGMFWAMPDSTLPARKITMAIRKSCFRPNRSPSLP